ncbi:DUF5753 domain-containing protein [Saccharopolyspora elongata]|uniref:XRE family transcriptional regulator n=1 Tax=Saccharopolyspora elongata TaxID=2530387 RepID=A0A4R4Z4A6_9PSEU|nr:DUF5753 domain-containing protein [Saccharopolyspora elongata]TDD52260.1 XRE family transcriptional regulator [Saccharopolyspora elongata]
MVTPENNPAVRRVQLGLLLRELRERNEIKPKVIADRLDWYSGKLTRVEKGELTIAAAEMDVLIDLFGVVDADEAEKLRRLASDARKRDRPSRVPDWARTYTALEAAAAEVKAYKVDLVPGIMQTEDYARAVLSTSLLTPSSEIDERAAERTQRGEMIVRNDAREISVVLGEGVLCCEVGGRDVLRAQLRRIRELADLRHVTVQILPYSRGEHVAIGTPFTVLHLADPVATYACLEGLTDADYLDRPSHTNVYVQAFDRLRVAALDDRESARLLEQRANELE